MTDAMSKAEMFSQYAPATATSDQAHVEVKIVSLTEREDAKHASTCERWQWEPEDRHGVCDCGADAQRGKDHLGEWDG